MFSHDGRFRDSPELRHKTSARTVMQPLVWGYSDMINAIKLLRTTGDACERKARQVTFGATQAELYDIAAEWHWLAGEAAKLYEKEKDLESAA